MSAQQHDYTARIQWTGNAGQGTTKSRNYQRTWDVSIPGKPIIHCSNDPMLGGDPALHNPEDLLLASLSACHMLWYLHLTSSQNIVVHSYLDNPVGLGETSANGAGRFLSASLYPIIQLSAGSNPIKADAVHTQVDEYCFIARSLNFPVLVEATYEIIAD